MKLYYSPGACALSPNISLREAGMSFELEQVDLKTKLLKSGGDFLAINPKGYVPALRLDDGQLLTEGAIMVQWIADQVPDKKLAPPAGTMERLRLQEWLHFISTELHKGASPLYNVNATEELKASLRERLTKRFAILEAHMTGRQFIMGDTFTVADPYAYYVLRTWKKLNKTDLSDTPALKAYEARLASRPSAKAALESEGIK